MLSDHFPQAVDELLGLCGAHPRGGHGQGGGTGLGPGHDIHEEMCKDVYGCIACEEDEETGVAEDG